MEQPARGLTEDLQVRLTDQEPLSCHDVYMPNHCVASFGSDFPYLVVLGGGQVVTQSCFPDVRRCTFHFLSPMMTPLYPTMSPINKMTIYMSGQVKKSQKCSVEWPAPFFVPIANTCIHLCRSQCLMEKCISMWWHHVWLRFWVTIFIFIILVFHFSIHVLKFAFQFEIRHSEF